MSSSTKSVIVSGKSEYEDYQSLSRCSTKEADSFVEPMVAMLQNIKDEKTKELLLLQMRAVSSI